MPQISHISRFMQRGNRGIHYITGKDSIGRDCYFFIMPRDEKDGRIQQLNGEDEDVDMNELGHIVAAGFGLEPSEAVTAMLIKHYQIDPALIIKYAAEARAENTEAAS